MKFQSRQDKFDCSIDGSLLRREKGGIFFVFRIKWFNLIVSSFYLKYEKLLLLILKSF